MRKGQVTVYILVGLFILVSLLFFLYLLHQSKASYGEPTGPKMVDQNVLLEQARMQGRIDSCLNKVTKQATLDAQANGLPATSLQADEEYLAQGIAESFPNCYFQASTDELLIVDDQAPRVNVVIDPEDVVVDVAYASQGEYDGQSYTLSEHHAQVPTKLGEGLDNAIDLERGLSGETPLYDAAQEPLVDAQCNVNLYAYDGRGWYADLIKHDDGTMTALLYDYGTFGEQGVYPVPLTVELPKCEGAT